MVFAGCFSFILGLGSLLLLSSEIVPKNVTFCFELHVEFGVVPYVSWGTMDNIKKKEWEANNCDALISQNLTKHHHHHHHHHHTTNSSDEGDKNVICKKLQTDHKVVPGASWGTLGELDKKTWNSMDCDRLRTVVVATAPIPTIKSSHHSHHHATNLPHLLHDGTKCNGCLVELLHMNEITSNSLESALAPFETSSSNITWVVIRSTANQSVEVVGAEIDDFIVKRPWWIPDLEPYKWFPWKRDIILYKAPTDVLPYFEAFIKHQFVDENICRSSPLYVSNIDGDAWGNRLLNVQMQWKNYLESIFYIFSSFSAKENGPVSYAEPDLCPTASNKWECLFLPLSNCTLPTELVNCTNRECLPHPPGGQFYTNASAVGHIIPLANENDFLQYTRQHFRKDEVLVSNECIDATAMKSSNLISITNETTISGPRCIQNRMGVAFTYGMHVRFNAEFRSLVARKVFDFRQSTKPVFNPGDTCVAAHIRMGDRNILNTNMIDWCLKCSMQVKDVGVAFNQSCKTLYNIDGSTWTDMGCVSGLPFGASSLQHYINASLVMMPHNRNLYIMTDDPAWLNPQIEAYHNRTLGDSDAFKIFTYAASPEHRQRSSDATVEFWASIKLAQQCQAFAGHFSSASTLIIYRALCFRHSNHRFIKCPLAYDIGGVQL